MKSIKVKSPTRVDLAGGTLDMWPLHNFVGSASTINVAIDIWTSSDISERNDRKIKIQSLDLNQEWLFESLEQLFESSDLKMYFYQCIFNFFKKDLKALTKGFEIVTSSESPIGGGLGGSSSLIISILKSLYTFFELPIPNAHDLVRVAHNIEAQMLRTPTGTQDYYAAIAGGLNVIDYKKSEIRLTTKTIEDSPLADHFLLVYTGKSHHSGLNNFEVLKSSVQGDPIVLSALHKIRDIAVDMKKALEEEKWDLLPGLFKAEYEARVMLTPAFTSPEIQKLSKLCLASGAMAVKICGAGGGGCVLVWVAPEFRERVIQACQNEKFQCLTAKPVRPM